MPVSTNELIGTNPKVIKPALKNSLPVNGKKEASLNCGMEKQQKELLSVF